MTEFDLGDVSVTLDGRDLPIVDRPRMLVVGGGHNMGLTVARALATFGQSAIIEFRSLAQHDEVLRGVNDRAQIWIDEATAVLRDSWTHLVDYCPRPVRNLVRLLSPPVTTGSKRRRRQLAQRLARRAMRKAMR